VASEQPSTRQAAIAQMGVVMRDFMARAVLFQDAVARSVSLNSSDLQTVGLLLSHGPTTPGDLAQRTGLTAGGAITAVIDRLERAGYVSRRRDQSDRRRVLVEANADKVMADVGATYGRVAARWESFLETLSDEKIEFAVELFSRAADINREEAEALRHGRP
jgi:DNA-binding MarR family transcriptional regulator